jgi:hypothetical protein
VDVVGSGACRAGDSRASQIFAKVILVCDAVHNIMIIARSTAKIDGDIPSEGPQGKFAKAAQSD